MPWRDISTMEEKIAFIDEYRSGSWTMVELCQVFGISRTLGYKYLNRYEAFGFPGLEETSRRPESSPSRTPQQVVERILELKKEHPRYGAETLRTKLLEQFPGESWPAISTINLILKRNGLVVPRKRKRHIVPVHPYFDPQAPNDLWSADYKGKIKMGNGAYVYPLTIQDSFSRYLFAAQALYHPTFEATQAVAYTDFRGHAGLRSCGAEGQT
jgi:putative transposase